MGEAIGALILGLAASVVAIWYKMRSMEGRGEFDGNGTSMNAGSDPSEVRRLVALKPSYAYTATIGAASLGLGMRVPG